MIKKFNNRLRPVQIITLGFFLIIIIASLILNMPFVTVNNMSIGYINSLFQVSSAVCVTGLSVIDIGKEFNIIGQVIMLILIQVGGLGFMSINTIIILFIGRKISLKSRMVIQEALNFDTLEGVVKWTKKIIFITFFIEIIGAIFLSFEFVPKYGLYKGFYYSIFHSISAFCNAGFDILGNGNSLMNYSGNVIVNITIMILITLGSIGFITIYEVLNKRNFRKYSLHTKIVIKSSMIIFIIGFFSYLIFEYSNIDIMGNKPFYEKILISAFGSVTARTAGFATIDYTKLNLSTAFITLILMFIGGASGSVAGGVKVTTITVLFLTARAIILGKENVEIYNRTLPRDLILKAICVFIVSIFLNLVIILMLIITQNNVDLITILFEVISAFATVGLSMNFTYKLTIFGKILIILSMFIGRIGAITLLMSLATSKNNANVKYPYEKIMIG